MSCSTSSLAGVDTATLQQWLSDARQARQQLMTGKKPQSISYAQGDGARSVAFTPANLGELNIYIQQLEKALGLGRRRAAGVRF